MLNRGTIRIDVSNSGIVIVCDVCPHWYSFQFTRVKAWRAAAEHEELCHPETTQARRSLYQAMRRAGNSPAVESA